MSGIVSLTNSKSGMEHERTIPHIRYLLLSKTSYDKRSTANTILQKYVFNTNKVITTPQEERVPEVDFFRPGHSISVVDTPGLMDSGLSKQEVTQVIDSTLKGDKNGFNAVLLVFRYPVRYTPEEQESIECMKSLIKEDNLRKYGIVVFTNGWSFANKTKVEKKEPREIFNKYIESECASNNKNSFGHLLRLMPDRYVFLDNDCDFNEGCNLQELMQLYKLAARNTECLVLYRSSIIPSFNNQWCKWEANPITIWSIHHWFPSLLQWLLSYLPFYSSDVDVNEDEYDQLSDQDDSQLKPELEMAEGGPELLEEVTCEGKDTQNTG